MHSPRVPSVRRHRERAGPGPHATLCSAPSVTLLRACLPAPPFAWLQKELDSRRAFILGAWYYLMQRENPISV